MRKKVSVLPRFLRKKKTLRFGLVSDRFAPTEADTDIGTVGSAETTAEVLPEVHLWRSHFIIININQ